MRHLLVTNDFPPKVGGIQSYLWELWRRLPHDDVTVLTTPHPGATEWDRAQGFRIERTPDPVLLPHPGLVRRINALAREVDAELVVLDPVLPLAALGPALERRYAVVAHGAEITIPGRLPVSSIALGAVARRADLVIAAGGYPLAELERAAGTTLRSVVIPPGVDTERFVPLRAPERRAARAALGLPATGPLITSFSRLVPRKGMDTLIRASARLAAGHPDLVVAIAGTGRDRPRLERLANTLGAPVVFMGRLDDEQLGRFAACGDVFAMLCRDRWLGLEQEGFGIVFLEAAACGVPAVAGRSGGSHEAVDHGVTGLIIDQPTDVIATAEALHVLLSDHTLRRRLGRAARVRAVAEFSYDVLAASLRASLDGLGELDPLRSVTHG